MNKSTCPQLYILRFGSHRTNVKADPVLSVSLAQSLTDKREAQAGSSRSSRTSLAYAKVRRPCLEQSGMARGLHRKVNLYRHRSHTLKTSYTHTHTHTHNLQYNPGDLHEMAQACNPNTQETRKDCNVLGQTYTVAERLSERTHETYGLPLYLSQSPVFRMDSFSAVRKACSFSRLYFQLSHCFLFDY